MELSSLPVVSAPTEIRFALLGGTHMNDAMFPLAAWEGQCRVMTPEGESPPFLLGNYEGVPFVYVHFHGQDCWLETWLGLRAIGVKDVLTGASAGGINRLFSTGDWVVPDDAIDLNVDRPVGFPVKYLESPRHAYPRLNPPMDALARQILLEEARRVVRAEPDMEAVNIHGRGVHVQTRGSRFETPAEVNMLRSFGADLVSMNVGTEIVYARQLGMHCACLNLISNPAEGLGEWTWQELKEVYIRSNPLGAKIILATLKRLSAVSPEHPRTLDDQRAHLGFGAD